MIREIKIILNKPYSALESANSPLIPYFQEGKKREEIVEMFKEIDVDPPEELIMLYEWRNGINLEEAQKNHIEIWFLPFDSFLSLEDAVATYKARVEHDEYWRKKLVSVFNSKLLRYSRKSGLTHLKN